MIIGEAGAAEARGLRGDNSKYPTRAPSPAPRASRRGQLLKDQLELVKAPGGGDRYTIKPLTSELPFDKALFVFVRAVQLLSSKNKGSTIVIGLAGPSGSGKTAFAKKVSNLIPGCAMLSMDNYNDGSKVIDGNFDDPRITDYDTLLRNLSDLKQGKAAQVPIYDFKQSCRVGYRTVEVPESRVVILEGIYALSHRVSPLLDLKVSITGGVHFDLVKRVLRDIERSGQPPEDIIQQVSDTVYPMYKAFIEPDLKTAHLRIYNPFNPFSGFMNPTYILKSVKQVDIEAMKESLGLGDDEAMTAESETYDIYLVPPAEDAESCQSWLRMRYRDGRYNLMFEEWVVEDKFIISPRVTFEVPVRILGGLMALGYEIGTIMQRTSKTYFKTEDKLTVKVDHIVGVDRQFVQIQGKDRNKVAEMGRALGLEGTYYPHSYIEIIQLENLTQDFLTVSDDLKRRFTVNGEPLDEAVVGSLSKGSSPLISGSFLGTSYGHHKASGSLCSSPHDAVPFSSSAPQHASKPMSMPMPIGSIGNANNGSTTRPGLLSQKIHAASVRSVGSDRVGAIGLGVTPEKQTGSPHGSMRSSSGTSQPDTPAGQANNAQLKQLLQSQALLTSQIEDLTMQLKVVSSSLGLSRNNSCEISSPEPATQSSAAATTALAASAGVCAGILASYVLFGPRT